MTTSGVAEARGEDVVRDDRDASSRAGTPGTATGTDRHSPGSSVTPAADVEPPATGETGAEVPDRLAGLDEQRRRLVRAAEQHLTEDLLLDLVSTFVDTPSPTGDEAPLARLAVGLLSDAGLEATTVAMDERQASTLARLRSRATGGAGDGPDLMLYAPIDTLTAGDPALDLPWAGERDGSRTSCRARGWCTARPAGRTCRAWAPATRRATRRWWSRPRRRWRGPACRCAGTWSSVSAPAGCRPTRCPGPSPTARFPRRPAARAPGTASAARRCWSRAATRTSRSSPSRAGRRRTRRSASPGSTCGCTATTPTSAAATASPTAAPRSTPPGSCSTWRAGSRSTRPGTPTAWSRRRASSPRSRAAGRGCSRSPRPSSGCSWTSG